MGSVRESFQEKAKHAGSDFKKKRDLVQQGKIGTFQDRVKAMVDG